MEPTGVDLVNVGEWLGLLRWLTLGILIAATFIFLKKDRNEQKNKRGLAMLVVTIIAMPILILEITYKTNTEETDTPEEIAEIQPSKKPSIDDGDIPTIKPINEDEEEQEDEPQTPPSQKKSSPSYRPKEAPKSSDSSSDQKGQDEQDGEEEGGGDVNPDAPTVSYKIIHRKMILDGSDYEIADTETASGKAGTKVTPTTKSYTGFTAPTATQVTLPDNNDLEITLDYTRNKYQYTINSGSVTSTLPNGEYYYETPITVAANAIAGYTFASWNDGSTDNPHSFTLTGKTTIEPIYNPNTDTHYQVSHQKKNLNDSNYTEANLDDGYGTTGTEITPPVRSYTGFKTPSTQTAIIAGDGSTRVIYKYDREQYSYSYGNSEYVESSKTAGNYDYETPITLKAKNRAGYQFAQWSNGQTDQEITITLTGDTTITPEYTANNYNVVFDANGGEGTMSNQQMTYDTPLALTANSFTRAHYQFVHWNTASDDSGTSYNDSEEVNNLVESGNFTLYAIWIQEADQAVVSDIDITVGETSTITISNADQIEPVTFSSSNSAIASVDTNTGSLAANVAGTATITITGTISGKTKTITVTVHNPIITLEFNANGGESVTPTTKNVEQGTAIGELPEASWTHHIFLGWYSQDGSVKLKTDTVISEAATYYAHWKKDITLAEVENIEVTRGSTAQIIVTNASELEAFTYSSGDDTKATVNTSGEVTGIAVGETTIILTGSKTGETKTINVKINEIKYTIEFNPNGGTPATIDALTLEENEKPTQAQIPGVTRTDYVFDGWWNSDKTVEFTTNTPTTKNETYTAHWKRSISQATIEDITVEVGEDNYISIQDIAEYEQISFSSADDTIATVAQDGTVRGVAEGTVIITVSGVQSGASRQVTVTVTDDSQKIVCKEATELDFELCTGENCTKDGFSTNDKIIYGQLPGKTAKAGDAYDCDLNGDGDYNKRFYYLGKNGDNAVLYMGENIAAKKSYDVAPNSLPSEDDTNWSNISTVFNGKKARFATVAEIRATNCNPSNPDDPLTATGSLKRCPYLMSHTAYASTSADLHVTALWLQDINGTKQRIHSGSRNLQTGGSESGVRPVIEVALSEIEPHVVKNYTVTFNALGGEEVASITDEEEEEIELPYTSKAGHTFKGWSTTENIADVVGQIGDSYTLTSNITLYAIWEQKDYKACYDTCQNESDYENTLQAVIDKVNTDGVKKTVRILKNITDETPTIAEGQNVEFDLQNFTISRGTTNAVIVNGMLTIKNGTISCAADSGAINIESTGTLYVTGGTISATGSRQAIYNNGGKLYISGNPTISNTTNQRAAVHNKSGTTVITGGTITSGGTAAVKAEAGSLTIGEKDGYIDTSTPVIRGKTYGVDSSVNYSFYDGSIAGESGAVGKGGSTDTNYSRITNIETDSAITPSTIDSYSEIHLEPQTPKYNLHFDGNGGTANPERIAVNQGAEIGQLPTADRGAYYDFDGWWTEATGGAQITAQTIPDGNLTYYAHWLAHPSEDIVQFNIHNEAIDGYYANVASLSSNKDAWLKFLKTNFDSNTCMYSWKDNGQENDDISSNFKDPDYLYTKNITGTKCDQPRNYDTGISEGVDVYESDESTKTKSGSLASYIDASDGKIRNTIPGQTYFWKSKTDPNVYGYIKASGNRRFIELPGARNVRDLGGLTGDGGTIKYGRLIRGEALKTADIAALATLGIDTEYELRISDQGGSHMANRVNAGTINYDIAVGTDGYTNTRKSLKQLMQDIVAGKSIYFHCTHGADRTGTIAYLAETLLGVSKEDRFQDFELTSLSGRPDRTRYYEEKSGNHKKFLYMTAKNDSDQGLELETYDSVLQWYLAGTDDEAADRALIAAFKAEILE